VVTQKKLIQTSMRYAPLLLLVLPLQLVTQDVSTTTFIAICMLGTIAALLLYPTNMKNETIGRLTLLALYSAAVGYVAQMNQYELYTLQHVSWLISVSLALYTVVEPKIKLAALPRVDVPMRWLVASGAVGVVAFAIRIYGIQSAPVIGGDEVNAALFGLEILNGTVRNFFQSGWYEFPALWFIFPALSHGVFSDPVWALRGHAILAGSLSCVVFVWALRPMVTSFSAVAGGLLLAFFGLHVYFSQIGLNNIYDGLSMIVLLGLLARQSDSYASMRWRWIGLCLGLALYGYTSARVLPLLVIVWAVRMWWHRPQERNELLHGVAVAFAVMVVVIAPLAVHYLYRPDNFMAPLVRFSFLTQVEPGVSLFARIERETGVTLPGQIVRHVWLSIKAMSIGPIDGWYRFPRGVVGPILVIPLLIGFVRAIDTLRRPMWHVAVFGVLYFVVVSVLSHPVGAGQRLIAVIPLLILLILIGLEWIHTTLSTRIPHVVATSLVGVMLAVSMYVHITDYFTVFLWRDGGLGDVNTRVVDYYGQFVRRLPAGTVVDVLVSRDFQKATNAGVGYHARHVEMMEISEASKPRMNADVWFIPADRVKDMPPVDGVATAQYIVMPEGKVWFTIIYRDALRPYLVDLPHTQRYPPTAP
jgi:hypothetical protein